MTGVNFPQYTLRERIADGCIHVIGVTASLVALTALLIMGVQAQADAVDRRRLHLRLGARRHVHLLCGL